MLQDLNLKSVYKSDEDNILEDFYFPALSIASTYDRAVGFFSASTISYAAQALTSFVQHGGRIRLILGAFTDKGDIEAVQRGYDRRELAEKIGSELLGFIEEVSDDLFQNRLEALAWLVMHGRLDVKIALREHGMYHDKIGIISDANGDSVAFSGSANESTRALLPAYNYESINVFPSWRPELDGYFLPHKRSFERLWNDESRDTVVLDLPTAVRERLVAVAGDLNYTPSPEIEQAIARRVRDKVSGQARSISSSPRLPQELGGRPFKMQDHQVSALEAWRASGDFQGVFDLATGAGKTITAIYGTCRLAERVPGLTCVIAVPYQNLADQWVDILAQFNIYPLRCYISRQNWLEKMRGLAHDMLMGSRTFAAIVVVNRTLKTREFQQALQKIPGERLLWIGDECHHHSSEVYSGFLPDARFRIGLSATPQHYLDEERNERLNAFYGEVVYRYTLKQAIEDKVLTPYYYFPHVVELTQDEAEEFVALSEQIGRLVARRESADRTADQKLTALLMRRARLVGAAANKLPALNEVLAGQQPNSHTLFYCGDGSVETDEGEDADGTKQSMRQVEALSETLHRAGWDVSRFTSRESRQDRERILENFRVGVIDALVAIRCLDEGIDVPACSTAYILASSRDPRQFIQRRGRILRRSPGKASATIHDFIVVLPEGQEEESEYARRLIKAELGRVAEFATLSENRSDAYVALANHLRRYDLEHLI